MIYRLKFYEIKCQKAGFFMNKVDLSDLNDKLFSIVMLYLALFCMTAHHVCLFFDVIGIIPTSI